MTTNESVPTGLVDPIGWGEDPLYYVTRVYLLFLQGLFEQFPAGNYKWSEDEKLTEIIITDQVPLPMERMEQRPAIVTILGPAQFANMTLDNMQSFDAKTGTRRRSDLVSATMTINCIAKMGPEASRISWLVMRHLRTFKTMLQRTGIHKIGDDLQRGTETPPGAIIAGEGTPEAVMFPVFSPFHIKWTEIDRPDSPVCQHIETKLHAGLGALISNPTERRQAALAGLNPPTIRGRVIPTRPPA